MPGSMLQQRVNLVPVALCCIHPDLASHEHLLRSWSKNLPAIVTVDHTYEASAVQFPDGRVEVQTLPEGSKERLKKASQVRVKDIQFVIDQITVLEAGNNPDVEEKKLPQGLSDVFDLTRIGIFGHSAGGYTAARQGNLPTPRRKT